MSDSSLNLWDLPSISAPIMGCFFIVIMSPHQQFDRQFTIHKEVQILTKKQERRTTNLDDTPLYSHANLLSCLFILLYSDFLHLRLYFSFVFLHINLKCICTILLFLFRYQGYRLRLNGRSFAFLMCLLIQFIPFLLHPL